MWNLDYGWKIPVARARPGVASIYDAKRSVGKKKEKDASVEQSWHRLSGKGERDAIEGATRTGDLSDANGRVIVFVRYL